MVLKKTPYTSTRPVKTRCNRSATTIIPKFKKWCDEYFYLKHRKEPRGIGGIFFDDLNKPDFDTCFGLTKSVGDHFLSAYVPLLEAHLNAPYGERERDFQAYRRGRYVEFNLVWDRGTLLATIRRAHGIHSHVAAANREMALRLEARAGQR